MTANIKRKVYMEKDDYKVRLEETQHIIFVHVELKGKMSTSIVKDLRTEFVKLKNKIKAAGYTQIFSYSATPKFYSLFKGYEDIGPMECEGVEYRVLKWELK